MKQISHQKWCTTDRHAFLTGHDVWLNIWGHRKPSPTSYSSLHTNTPLPSTHTHTHTCISASDSVSDSFKNQFTNGQQLLVKEWLFSLFPWLPLPLSMYGCFWSVIHITAPRVPHPDDHLSLLALGFLALPWACSALCFVLLQLSLPVFSWFPEASFLPSRRRDHSEPRCLLSVLLTLQVLERWWDSITFSFLPKEQNKSTRSKASDVSSRCGAQPNLVSIYTRSNLTLFDGQS